MLAPEVPRRSPSDVPASELVVPDVFDLTFEGFSSEAFAILERLRDRPHIEQYREEKTGIREHLKEPFKRYRDDLVVNWALPNRLALETEKNVFSRLLKNDFGAGGCHHHLWMSFYRPGGRRLTDLQLPHSIDPDGFSVGLYAGDYARAPLARLKSLAAADSLSLISVVNPLLETGDWRFYCYRANDRRRMEPGEPWLEEIERADGIWIRRHVGTEEAIRLGGGLVRVAVEAIVGIWPLYRRVLED